MATAPQTPLEPSHAALLRRAAAFAGTPCYAYLLDVVQERIGQVRAAFPQFEISFAAKSNPNVELLRTLVPAVDTIDASSFGEVERALHAGFSPGRISFSGPAKRPVELERAIAQRCGLLVCESFRELEHVDALARARGSRVPVAIRINPRQVPRNFGVNMAGKPSQFGIDEEDLPGFVDAIRKLGSISLDGFHIYSGTNALNEEAIAENFGIFRRLFSTFAEAFDIRPRVLIFGSGFGIPYHPGQSSLELSRLSALVAPLIESLRNDARLRDARLALEMGRFLVGPAGYFLTSVVAAKRSRGTDIRLCDGGFNNHLAAFGLMGTVIRRNWSMWNLSAGPGTPAIKQTLVGPLCTTIDTLAQDVELPALEPGDLVAVGASGAYGLTASPIHFISHPVPRETLVRTSAAGDWVFQDVSESDSQLSGAGALQSR
jgi:diaminopimelate decarboxylase